MTRLWAMMLVAGAVLVGCGQQAAPPAVESAPDVATWQQIEPAAMTPEQQAQADRCMAARDGMMSQLLGELQEALAGGGPSAAIEVCSIRAPEIAAEVSNRHALLLGRTSFRLRNTANAAPDWAVPLVEARAARPTYLAGPTGELGAVFPILTRAECLQCHGPAEQLSAEVRAALADLYPDDQATGFAEGDLRGWLWVEAPATPPVT